MNKDEIISKIVAVVKERLATEGSGHDWWHVYRVWQMAKRIGTEEKADLFVVELAALLHDIADWKMYDGDDTIGPRVAGEVLEQYGVSLEIIKHIQQVIYEGSFKGAGVTTKPSTHEGEIVQDADRLDAVGAIGIARTFAYGGHKGRLLYDPNIKPVMHTTKESYSKNTSPTVNHFYEKLLLLKDLMNTDTAKKIAKERHEYMETFLAQFFDEWEGKK